MGDPMKERRLGTGLEALLGPQEPAAAEPAGEIELERIRPNPYQPRTDFAEEEIRSLAESIKATGLLQPLLVRPQNGHYELVAGERRLRAARAAGLARVPALVRPVADEAMLLQALVENVMRRDLNPVDKARAIRKLLEQSGSSHERAAAALGMERSSLTNIVRLLELPPEILTEVSRGTISMGHARALLGAAPRARQLALFARLLKEELSVRRLEALVAAGPTAGAPKGRAADPNLAALEAKLSDFFGTRVTVAARGRGGRIVVEYFDNDQFAAILSRLGL
jgi:ParB family chromosome partitioning protein